MITKASMLVLLPGTALLGLGLSHTNLPSGSASSACPPAGETAAAAGLVFGDVDGDGLDDAFVVAADGRARLLMNFGEGRFEDVTLAANLAELGGASCALFADFDGDGRADLFAGSSEHRLWKNLGNATFEPMPSGIDHDLVDLGAQAVDRDQDGRLDLQIHTEAGDLVYRNLGEGRFERVALPLGELVQAPAHVGWIAPDSMDDAGSLAAPDAGSPAERRLDRWVQGRALGGFASTATSSSSGSSSMGPSLPMVSSCLLGVRDANGGACIGASSVPTLGKLYPLSSRLFVASSGNIGINTTSPATTFAMDIEDVGAGVNWKGAVAAGGSIGQKVVLGQLNGVATVGAHNGALSAWTNLDIAGEDIAFKWNNGPGNVTRLSIDGSSGLVSVKQSLEIRGGADIVERFESSCGTLEPGTVVAIDPQNPGQLACSFGAYDTKVAGVVSGAGGVKPGLCLSQDGHLDGDTPVAMNGRVYVKCSTENGAIRPGDRLTTASLAGHAMKVTDEQRSVGAVIGKAMSSLDEGMGLVLVLVNLQ
jgi:hypothetical protein